MGHIYNFARATWGLGWQKHGEKELRKFLLGCYFFDLRIGACIDANHPLFWLILTVLGHIYNFARATWGLGWQKHGEKELRTFLLGCFFFDLRIGACIDMNHPFFYLILSVLDHIYNFARATWGLG